MATQLLGVKASDERERENDEREREREVYTDALTAADGERYTCRTNKCVCVLLYFYIHIPHIDFVFFYF
jgi:hypothetical protein